MIKFDNTFAKPPQLSKGSLFSVVVLFHVELQTGVLNQMIKFVNGGVFSGQYNYETGLWFIHGFRDDFLRENELPVSIDWSLNVPDDRVDYWWHLPDYESVCLTYKEAGGELR